MERDRTVPPVIVRESNLAELQRRRRAEQARRESEDADTEPPKKPDTQTP
jgi:hypothetical protein